MNEKKTPRRIIKKGYQPKKQPVKTNPSKVKPPKGGTGTKK